MNLSDLAAIRLPIPPAESPGSLTAAEVAEIIPFFRRRGETSRVIPPDEYEGGVMDALEEIQARCQRLADRRQNDNATGLEDFDIAIVDTDPDADGRLAGFADAGDLLVVRHKRTKRTGHFDLIYPGGFQSAFSNGAYSTGGALVRMGL